MQKDGRLLYLTEAKNENQYWNIPIANKHHLPAAGYGNLRYPGGYAYAGICRSAGWLLWRWWYAVIDGQRGGVVNAAE